MTNLTYMNLNPSFRDSWDTAMLMLMQNFLINGIISWSNGGSIRPKAWSSNTGCDFAQKWNCVM